MESSNRNLAELIARGWHFLHLRRLYTLTTLASDHAIVALETRLRGAVRTLRNFRLRDDHRSHGEKLSGSSSRPEGKAPSLPSHPTLRGARTTADCLLPAPPGAARLNSILRVHPPSAAKE